jgi:subtilisin family serine protease
LRRGLLICGLLALAVAPPAHAANVEVVVTLKSPPLAEVFARHGTLAYSSFVRPNRLLLAAPESQNYLRRLDTAQLVLQARIQTRIPRAEVRWRFGVVLNGFAVVVPRSQLATLSHMADVQVWPSIGYHTLLDMTPQIIGAPTVWGPTLATAGQGQKIAIVDDGIDQTHPFFAPAGYSYPTGFPKGQTGYTTPKVIVARAFAPATPVYANAKLPFDPDLSDHGIHVAGIAAGNNNTQTRTGGFRLSGIAPRAYLGNYKALGIPSEFGANGNSPELAAAIEAAVRDGMDVINLSLGETEIDPSRDLVARALNAAADAGVVSAVSAGNDFAELGFGSITSPGNAAKAISVAASSGGHGSPDVDNIADFSSAGPTPYSLTFKPDVTAPGEGVASAAPGGGFVESSGTSMSAPHVAGAAALLRQRHPTWTPAQIKSALVLTGVPVHNGGTAEVSPLREGGGRIDLVRADQPLVFASPNISFGLLKAGASAQQAVSLTDADGGAGVWNVASSVAGAPLSLPAQVSVPGLLTVRAAIPRNAVEGEVTGFVVLSRDGARRRIPFWFRVERPRLRLDRQVALVHPGEYAADTSRGAARVSSYRYPDVLPGHAAFPVRLSGREIVYRVRIRSQIANFGVAVTARTAGVGVEPRVVRAGDENRLAGYTGLPFDQNPYRTGYGRHRLVAGVALPGPGVYDVVFDTPRGARSGAFRFRFWQNDVRPPSVRVLGVRNGFLELAVADGGSGVDPLSLQARIDGDVVPVSFASGRARLSLAGTAPGRHTMIFTASDYQEAKNMENVARILPNTRTVRTAFVRP